MLIYEVTEDTQNGLNLQTFAEATFRTNKTAAEISEAMNSGRGILLMEYSMVNYGMEEDESTEVVSEQYKTLTPFVIMKGEGILHIFAGNHQLRENPETGYLEGKTEK